MSTVYHQNVPGTTFHLPPIPPPIVRRPLADIKAPKTQSATKNCEWCKSIIPKEAIRCPECQEWEKDIIKHRKNTISSGSAAMFLLLAIAFLCFAAWPKTKDGDVYSDLVSKRYHPWHEKVPNNNPVNFGNSVTDQMFFNIYTNIGRYYWEFSLKNFLTSLTGWAVIVGAVSFVYTLCSFSNSQSILKQKTGSYFLL